MMKVQVVYNDGLYGDYFVVSGKSNSEVKESIKNMFVFKGLNIKKDLIKIIKL